MSAHCCSHTPAAGPAVDPRYRKALWIALLLNAAMFMVELAASWRSGSVALMADSIDFFGDAANYGLSLAVLAMAAGARAKAALFKAATMGAFGAFVLGKALYNLQAGITPEPVTMGAVGLAALAVNAGVALMLYRFRSGDANMRSVWICSRNDALGNVAVSRDARRPRRVRHVPGLAGPGGRSRDGAAGVVRRLDRVQAGPAGAAARRRPLMR